LPVIWKVLITRNSIYQKSLDC